MTKSTITRERLAKIKSWRETYGAGSNVMLPAEEAEELARMALAAMDSEPDCNERKLFCSTDTARMRKVISVSAGSEATPLHRHAQPAPVIPDFKKLARELVVNLVDCGGLDEGVKEKYLEWVEKTCRAAMLATAPQEASDLT